MDAATFWTKVRIGGLEECWEWIPKPSSCGYGNVTYKGKQRGAHRLAFLLTRGEIPDSLFVLHRCDNRRCCNPCHLFLGTQTVNIADKVAKGRQATGDRNGARLHPERVPRGSRNGSAKLTEAKVAKLRELRRQGWPLKRLAKRFGLCVDMVWRICDGRAWSHI
jgi:hypothetical protein